MNMVSQQALDHAVSLLRQGKLVAFPTETVYGLGADAANPAALCRIFEAKGRPIDHPLIVHIADLSQLSAWARDVSGAAMRLAEAFWPGPLTMILKKNPVVSDLVTGGQDTIGVRVPQHPVALALLSAFQGGLAAPSANRFGRISPTTAKAVEEELNGAVACILEGGQCAVGVESTIVDMSGSQAVILRPGMITAEQIEKVLQAPVVFGQQNSPRVSGALESHYAPQTKTLLMSLEKITAFIASLSQADLPLAVLHYSNLRLQHAGVESRVLASDPKNYAHDLYQVLREIDKKNFRLIVVEAVPVGLAWDAVRDRLQKASVK